MLNINRAIFLLTLFQGLLLTSILRVEKPDLGAMKCGPNLIKMYIQGASSSLITPIVATNEHKRICPALDITCCEVADLKKAGNNFLQGFYQMEEVRALIAGVNVWLSDITIDEAEAVAKELNPIDGLTPQQYAELLSKFKADWNQMITSQADIAYSFKSFTEEIRKYYAGFICEFCHPRTVQLIIDNQKYAEDEEHAVLPFSFANYIARFKIIDQMFRLIAKHVPHYKVLTSLKDEKFNPNMKEFFENPESINQIIKKCQSVQNAKDLDNRENRDCVELAWNSDSLVGNSSDHAFIVPFYSSLINLLNKKFRFNPRVVYPEAAESIEFCTQKGSKDKYGHNIMKFFPILDSNGFDMTRNLLSEEFWKVSALKNDAL
jgi:hypothetical protein